MYTKSHLAIILFGAFILAFTSCSRHTTDQKSKVYIRYPAPPDTARIQFLTTISSSADVAKKKSKLSKFIYGDSPPIPIYKPYGISKYKGKLFVCDVDLKGLEILDLNNKTFEQFVPVDAGQLKIPINSFVDDNGILYIADAGRRQVVVFDYDKNYINCFGDTGNFKPTDVFVYGNKVYVADSHGNRINVYRKGFLNLIDYFPKAEQGDSGFLYQPTNIYVTKDKIYVSDFGDFKVKIYTLEGKFIRSVGSYGKEFGQFVRPKGIAVDSTENLFVADGAFENVQVFNSEGKLLMFFGGSYKRPGDMWLPTKVMIDYNNLKYFSRYVDPAYDLKYLILVVNQFGPDKINVYGAIAPAAIKQ